STINISSPTGFKCSRTRSSTFAIQRRSLLMSTKPTIMKFGGTSVEDADAFRNVAAIVKSHLDVRPVIVVSAIAGFTNALLASAAKAINGDARAATKSLDDDFGRHSSIAEDVLSDGPRQAFELARADTRRQIRQLH